MRTTRLLRRVHADGKFDGRPGKRRRLRRPVVVALASLLSVALLASLMSSQVDAAIQGSQLQTYAIDELKNFIATDDFGHQEPVFVKVTTTNNGGGWLCIREELPKKGNRKLPCARENLRPLSGMVFGAQVPAAGAGVLGVGDYEIDGYNAYPKKGLAVQAVSNPFQINPIDCEARRNCDAAEQVFKNQACSMSRYAQNFIGQAAFKAILGASVVGFVGLVILVTGPAAVGIAVGAGGAIGVIAVINAQRNLAQTAKTYWEKVGGCVQSSGGAALADPYATPGNDFTAIVQPVFQPYDMPADPTLAVEYKAWQQHLAYVRAVSETIERLDAAKAAGDAVSVTRQQRALTDYAAQLSDAVDTTAVAHADMAAAVAGSTQDPTLSGQQIAEALQMRDRIAQSGFTAAEIDELHAGGLDDAEIAAARAEMASLDAIVEPGETMSDAMSFAAGDMGIGGNRAQDLSDAMLIETGPAPTNVVAHPDAATTPQGAPVDVSVLANDDAPAGAQLAVSAYDKIAANGATVACSALGVCTYTPALGFAGTDAFTYTAHSDGLIDATSTVTVTVTPRVPTAIADELTTAMNLNATVNVLANDVAPPGSTLTVTAFDPVTAGGGAVACTPQGTCSFDPPADVVGTDGFSYTVTTNQGASAVGTVAITVKDAIGPPPLPEDDAASTSEATPVTLNVLANDVAPPGSALHVIDWQFATANGGTVTCAGSGSCTYTPQPSFTGSDSFGYLVTTDGGVTDDAIATVDVTRTPPNVTDDAGRVLSGDALTLNVLANDVGAPGTTLSVSDASGTSVAGGTVTCPADGNCTYVSAPAFFGPDSFTYEASTAAGTTATATVRVQVDEKANGVPTAIDNNFDTAGAYAFDVLWNDSDPDVDPLKVTRVGAAAHGKASCDANGGCLYDPDPGYVGGDELTYDISDGRGGAATATVRINVVAAPVVNRPPATEGDVLATTTGGAGTVDVLANDTDADGHDLVVSSWTDGVHGDIECVAGGTCTYTAAVGYTGFDVFSYGVDDGHGGTATGTVLVRVSGGEATLDVAVAGAPTAGGTAPVARGATGTWQVATSISPSDLPQELAAHILPATIDLTTTGAHRIDPESVKLAKGWTADPTGTHFTAGPDALVGSSSVDVLGVPKPSVQQGTGGDGHVPIVVGNRVFAFFHHSYPTSVTCVDLDLARSCPGYPKTVPFLTSDLVGPAAIVGSQIYVHMVFSNSNVQTGPITMYCWDTATDETCGMINLDRVTGTLTPNTSAPVGVDGKVYLAADNGRVYCYDPATHEPCTTPSVQSQLGATLGRYYDRITHDGLLYISRSDVNQVACIDAATMGRCTGWDGPKQFNGWNLVTRHDATGAATGACIAVPGSPLTCVDDGAPDARFLSAVNWPAIDSYWTVTEEAEAGTRTLYGLMYNVAGMGCWDWVAGGPCTGGDYTANGYLHVDTSGNGLPPSYGGVFDGECVITVGDTGFVYTVDPQGAAPCSRSNTTSANVIDLRDQRVDGSVGAASWTSVVVNGANLRPNSDFRSFVVTVRDPDTGELLIERQMVGTTGVIDLRGVDAKLHPSLVVGARFATEAGSPGWADGDPPRLVTNWTADPAQVEVRTIAEGSCVKTPELITLTASVVQPAASVSGDLQTAGTGCAPIAFAVLDSTPEDTPVTVGFLAVDADKDPLTYKVVDGPDHGTTSGTGGSSFSYTPEADFNGVDAITYVTNDGTSDSAPSQIVVTVTPVNDRPVSDPANAATIENIAVEVPLSGSDVDGDPLAFRVVTPPAHGTVAAAKPGTDTTKATITYTPAPGYFGSDTFEFVAGDGTADSAAAVATITVQADPTTTTTSTSTSTTTSSTTAPTSTTGPAPTTSAAADPTAPTGANVAVTSAPGNPVTSVVTAAPQANLPLTGGDTLRLFTLAVGLLCVGGVVLLVGRRWDGGRRSGP